MENYVFTLSWASNIFQNMYMLFNKHDKYVSAKDVFRAKVKTPAVYFFYDKDRVCLYVGSTENFRQRWAHHQADKDLSDVRAVEIYTHRTMSEVLFNESQAIVKHQPLWNIRGKDGEYSDIKIPWIERFYFIYKHPGSPGYSEE